MRGKPDEPRRGNRNGGITPADAGKTGIGDGGSRVSEDHPRGCGENRIHALGDFFVMGSPPRMRGKLNQTVAVFCFAGITPADAGKT